MQNGYVSFSYLVSVSVVKSEHPFIHILWRVITLIAAVPTFFLIFGFKNFFSPTIKYLKLKRTQG